MTHQSEAARAPAWPNTGGELLRHIEQAGQAGQWVVSTDPADVRDLCCPLRRTFRLAALGDAEAGLVCEYGHVFVVLGQDFHCLLPDLWRPVPLSEVLAEKQWCDPSTMVFMQAIEALFPRGVFAPTTRV